MNYGRWRIDRTYLLVPAQDASRKYIATFKDFTEPEGRQLLARSGAGEAHGGEHQRKATGDTRLANTRRPAGIGCRP